MSNIDEARKYLPLVIALWRMTLITNGLEAEKQIAEKLAGKDLSPEAVELFKEVVEALKQEGYLSDE